MHTLPGILMLLYLGEAAHLYRYCTGPLSRLVYHRPRSNGVSGGAGPVQLFEWRGHQ